MTVTHKPKTDKEIQAIVIVPTRDLAMQIFDVVKSLLVKKLEYLKVILFIGGRNSKEDVKYFHRFGGNIIIGTPGKLKELADHLPDMISFKTLKMLIFDEADRLIESNYKQDLDILLASLPKQRRTYVFSATLG